jgi:hypothetical protein
MPTYSGTSVIPSGSFSVNVKLSELGYLPFPTDSYSVSITASNYEGSNTWIKNLSSDEFVINSYSSGEYKWIATNQDGPNTQVLYGTTDPPSSELGNVGDSYIDTTSGNMYSKVSTTSAPEWTEQADAGQSRWTSTASSADGIKLAACVEDGYIWTSTDSGETWVQRPSSGQRYWNDIACSSAGDKLVACSYQDSTIDTASYIYTSVDSGETWVPRYNSGYNVWLGVSSDSTGTVLVACAYESQYFYVSRDGGETWVQQPIIAQTYWTNVAISSDASTIIASQNGQYIYVGTLGESGYTWVQQSTLPISPWTAVASNSDGSVLAVCVYSGYIYVGTLGESGYTWVAQTNFGSTYQWENIKISADGSVILAGGTTDLNVYVGTLDAGVYTWAEQDPSPGAGTWYALSMSADGTKFAVADYGDSNPGPIWTYGTTTFAEWVFKLNIGGGGGGSAAVGPTGAIQLSDGAGGFTGSSELTFKTYAYIGGGTAYEIGGGSSLNAIVIQGGDNRDMLMYNNTDGGTGSIGLYSGGPIDLSAGTTLQVNTAGSYGAVGQYLGSDGDGHVVWSTPPTGVESALYQATYYKSTVQNLTSGNTDLTFDLSGAWNNPNGYITHTDGTTAFNVVQAGLYQLEFNATILANGATWTTTTNKGISIDITRSPTAEQGIIPQFALIASGTQYSQSACATVNLQVGDVINCRITNTFTGGPAQAQCIQNTIDLNTFFTWRYVSTGPAGPAGPTGTQSLQQTVNIGNGISNFGGTGQATIASTNFTSGRALTLNGNDKPTIHMVENDDSSKNLQIDTRNLYLNGTTYAWSSIVNPTIPTAQGSTGAIQLSDGAGGFTGSTGFYYQSDIDFYALHGGPNGNIIGFDDGAGSMLVGVGNTGGNLVLEGGVSGSIQLSGGSLQVGIGGTGGSSGQYLGSDGAGNVVWSTPAATPAQGPTGSIQLSDGAGGFTGSTGFYWDVKAGNYLLKGGVHGNYIQFDNSSGNMLVKGITGSVGMASDNNKVTLQGTYLTVATNSSVGTTGEYLGSDGAGNVVWSTPVSGIVESGAIDQTGFTLSVPDTQYYKIISIPSMNPNGLILATTSGTPVVCAAAWITTVIPGEGNITVWVAANPVMADNTWEAHYGIMSYGTPA